MPFLGTSHKELHLSATHTLMIAQQDSFDAKNVDGCSEIHANSAISMRRATTGGVRFVRHKGFVRACEQLLLQQRRGMQSIRCPADATEDGEDQDTPTYVM